MVFFRGVYLGELVKLYSALPGWEPAGVAYSVREDGEETIFWCPIMPGIEIVWPD